MVHDDNWLWLRRVVLVVGIELNILGERVLFILIEGDWE